MIIIMRWLTLSAQAVSFMSMAQIPVLSWYVESSSTLLDTFSRHFATISQTVYELLEVRTSPKLGLEKEIGDSSSIDCCSASVVNRKANRLLTIYTQTRFEPITHSEPNKPLLMSMSGLQWLGIFSTNTMLTRIIVSDVYVSSYSVRYKQTEMDQ